MRKRLSSHHFVAAIFSCLGIFAPSTEAGTFTVATSAEVRPLQAKIQAAQFLTHATFGATQAEIDALATEIVNNGTIVATATWIANQQALALNDSARHQPLLESMITSDFELVTAVNNNAVNISPLTQVQTPNRTQYRQYAWWHRSITNADQLRQKTAWALSQICAVGSNFNNFNEDDLDNGGRGNSNNSVTNPRKSRFIGITNYYDTCFVNNAFLRYRDVLQNVTYHPIMGDWLSSRGNTKAANNLFPDENYAREVMQLFSLGLYKLNEDGEQQTSAGEAIPTYDQDEIRELARVFTGLGYHASGYQTNGTADGLGSFQTVPILSRPMTMSRPAHDGLAKFTGPDYRNGSNVNYLNDDVNTFTFPALPVSSSQPTLAACNAEISKVLDMLVAHRTHPPYICRLLIQRLVKSNPSRAYIQRVVNAYKAGSFTAGNRTFGGLGRGDLRAVTAAILLDAEAFQPIRTAYLRNPNRVVVTTMGSEDSRVQEPVLNYTRFLRFFKATATYELGNSVLVPPTTGTTFTVSTTWGATQVQNPPVTPGSELAPFRSNEFRLPSRFNEFSQSPYSSPSVFNFYVSDYQPSGDLIDFVPSNRIPNQLQKLKAPEFQIVDAITSNRTANFFRTLVQATVTNGVQNHTHLNAWRLTNNQDSATFGPFTQVNTQGRDTITFRYPARTRILCDRDPDTINFADYHCYATQCRIAASLPNTLVTGATPLVEHLDLYLCGGTLHEGYRTKLIDRLSRRRNLDNGGTGGWTNAEHRELAQAAIQAVVTSPSFLVTE